MDVEKERAAGAPFVRYLMAVERWVQKADTLGAPFVVESARSEIALGLERNAVDAEVREMAEAVDRALAACTEDRLTSEQTENLLTLTRAAITADGRRPASGA